MESSRPIVFEHDIFGFKEKPPGEGNALSICFGTSHRSKHFFQPSKEQAEEFARHVEKLSFQVLSFRQRQIPPNLLNSIEPIDASRVIFNNVSVSAEVEDKLSDFMRTRKNLESLFVASIKYNSKIILKLFHRQTSLREISLSSISGLNVASLSRKLCFYNLSLLKLTGVKLSSMKDHWFLLKVLSTNKFRSLRIELSRMASRYSDLPTLFSEKDGRVKVQLTVPNCGDLERFFLKSTCEVQSKASTFNFEVSVEWVAVKSFASALVNSGSIDEILVKKNKFSVAPLVTLASRLNEAFLDFCGASRFQPRLGTYARLGPQF